MASQMSGAASLDVFHGLLLLWAEMMRLPVIITMAVEDPGNFKGGPCHDPLLLFRRRAGSYREDLPAYRQIGQ